MTDTIDLPRMTDRELATYLRFVSKQKHSVDGAIHLAVARILDAINATKSQS